MKVRVKFEKYGPARFMGHLDTMRYFQKAVRRAKIPVAFSSGFTPHMIMSFAAPLGLGISSSAEYFDMELSEGVSSGGLSSEELSSEELVCRLDHEMAEGFRVVGARKVPEGRKHNAMALTAAASYRVTFEEGCGLTAEDLEGFYAQPKILVEKESKSGPKTVDIRPGIYELTAEEGESFSCIMLLAASSADHVRPKMVVKALAAHLGKDLRPYSYTVHKIQVYAAGCQDGDPRFVPLESLGEEIG